MGQTTAELVKSALNGTLDYSEANRSFSPMYSDIGLGFKETVSGINEFYLHYNRRTTIIKGLLTYEGAIAKLTNNVLSVSQENKKGKVQYAFYHRNSFVIESVDTVMVHLDAIETYNNIRPQLSAKDSTLVYKVYLPTIDKRDPDEFFPFILGLKVIKGKLNLLDNGNSVKIIPDELGKVYLAISVNMLDTESEKIKSLLDTASDLIEGALYQSGLWLEKGLGDIKFKETGKTEERILAMALVSLLFNSAEAPGDLSGYISQFPSRGDYPTHFLWDTCFHNLGLDYKHPDLSKDALLLLLKNLRSDGKMAHFLSSTWMRPHDSQPPLVGWAALRLVKERGDLEFAKEDLPYLVQNTHWWLSQRMTDTGLIMTYGPYETGWDDTPRFDSGQVIATDMNTYLWLQINACAELAKLLGELEMANYMNELAETFGKRMKEVLFDANDEVFYDVQLETDTYLKYITPATFIPLLADLPITEAQTKKIIEDYLLNTEKMFGRVPFPSLAYDDPKYEAGKCWRGPTWLATAYLCLEVLEKHGYEKERMEAITKLYKMIIADGRISELFDSQTGKGLGNAQKGWTAAILLKLKMELDQ